MNKLCYIVLYSDVKAMKLSAEIKSAMVRNGLEQGDVADFFGITQQAVSQWMVKGDVPVKHRKKLSNILGIDIEKIIENNCQPATTQTTTGNNSPAQQHTGAGNMAMFDRSRDAGERQQRRNRQGGVQHRHAARRRHFAKAGKLD